MQTIKQLLDLFRLERMVYLAVTLSSVVVLLACAIILLVRKESPASAILGLFGASGGITYSTGRLLKMWSDAIRMLDPHLKDKDE
jgi:hypothetical protein